MSTRTVSHTVSSPVSSPIELIATLPTDPQSRKIPMTVILGFKTVEDEEPMSLASYHYAIPYRDTDQVVSTPLLDTNNDWIRDITRQVATIMCKKFHKPCYVGWSNALGQHTTPDQLFVVKNCIEFINDQLNK